MRVFELILLFAITLGLIMYLTFADGGGYVLTLSMGILSAFYFWFGFAFFNNMPLQAAMKKEVIRSVSPKYLIVAIFCGVNLATLILGILFALMGWPGDGLLLVVGMIPAVFFICYGFYSQQNLPKGYYFRLISRNTVFLFFGILMYFSPLFIHSIRYKNYPEALEAYKVYILDKTEENHSLYTKEVDRIKMTNNEFKKAYTEER